MGILNLFKKNKPTLLEDIRTASEWIIKAFNSSGYKLDYTIESFKEIDRFFDENSEDGKPKAGGLLAEGLSQRLFAIGTYVGETLRKNTTGSRWITDVNDPHAEVNAQIELKKNEVVWPIQKVMKRFQNGSEDSIYSYGITLKK